jgi:P27 family predicted phage terminase small subunit
VAPVLSAIGLLTSIDGDALALYCAAYARWADAEEHLAEDGVVVRSPTGYPIQNPYLAIANKAMEQMDRSLAKFGMTPADRTRVQAAPAPKPAKEAPAVPTLRIAR